MAGNSRDTTYRYVYAVTGDKDLATTADQLVKLADAGKLSDDEAIKLAGSLKTLAAQSRAVNDALSQKAGLAEIATQLQAAQVSLAKYRAETDATVLSSKKYQAGLAAAERSVETLTAKQNVQTSSLAKTLGGLEKAGIDTSNLAAANENLSRRASETATNLTAVAGRARETSVGLGEIAERSTVLSRVVDTVKELAVAFAGLFVLEKVKESIGEIIETGERFDDLGKKFATAFGGLKQGEEALEKVKTLAEGTPQGFENIAEAAIHLKRAGFDPLDGTLQALVDNQNALNQTQDQLLATIDALGKANVRGGVNLKALVSLTEQGIPVFDLLGKAMGKSADQVRSLAESGQLGQNSIKLLVSELGRLRTGAATSELGDTDAQVVKLKDTVDEFFNSIAHSGALQFFRDQIKSLNEEIKAQVNSGGLAKTAQAISDGIVATGRGVVAVTKFLYDHAAAISSAAKAYILFRTTLLAVDVASAVARFGSLSSSVRDVAAAATEAGGVRGALAALGARLAALPKAVQIAISVEAVDFAVSQIENLVTTTKELYDTSKRQSELEKDIGSQREQLAAKAGTLAAKLAAYADTQVASSQRLGDMSRTQADAYVQQLQNAIRYYNALRVQADAAGNSDGVAKATEKLKALGEALDAARVRSEALAAAQKSSFDATARVVDRFDALVTAGKSAAEAVAGAFNGIEIRTPEGLSDTVSIIQQIAIRSRDARSAVQAELVTALASLNAADLGAFQNNVTARLQGATSQADALSVALGAALQASLLKLGLTAEQAGVAVTQAGAEMIATFDDVASNANSSARQIQLAFAQALAKASTEGEVQALQQGLQQAFAAGKVGADALGVSMQAAGRKIADLKADAATASASLDGIGKSGETAAQRISSALQDARGALIAQEAQLSNQLATALAANDQKLADALTRQIGGVEAEIGELSGKIAAVGETKIPPLDVTPLVASLRQAIDTSTTASRAIAATGEASKTAGGMITGVLGPALEQMSAFMTEFGQRSQAAAQRYNELVEALFNGAGAFSAQAVADGTGIIRFGEAVQQAAQIVKREIAEEQESLSNLTASYANMSEASIQAMAQQEGGLEQVEARLRAQAEAVRQGRTEYKYLNESDLSGLESAIDSAAAKVEALREKTVSAQQAFEDYARSAEEQTLEIQGNQAAAENARFEAELERLKQQAQESNTLDSDAYQRAVAAANALHAAKLKQIQEEAAERKKSDDEAAKREGQGGGGGTPPPKAPEQPNSPQPGPPPKTPSPNPPPPGPQVPAQAGAIAYYVTINADGLIPVDARSLETFARRIETELARIGRNRF